MHQPSLVLIVEDDAPIATLVADIVAAVGHTPLVAAHGRQALALAGVHRPALVITDLMMPHLDGAGLIAALHAGATASHPTPPIVLMTAAGGQAARAAGADAILTKPFNLAELEALLDRFLAAP